MSEETKRIEPSKDELLDAMYENYYRQKGFCDMYYAKAMEKEEDGSLDLNINRKSKKENTDIREYNLCVSAMGITIAKILQIKKASYTNVEDDLLDEETDEEELV